MLPLALVLDIVLNCYICFFLNWFLALVYSCEYLTFCFQGVLYGSVGFVCGIIGQGIANTIMNAKRYAYPRRVLLYYFITKILIH